MKPALVILPLVLSLSACAQGLMTADACKPAEMDHLGSSAALLGTGIRADLQVLARDELNASRIVATTPCARVDKNPVLRDLHRLGDGPAAPGVLLGTAGCPKTRA